MQSTPLVSVIITCYNYGKYLEEAIESVLGQDYPAIETIVVDDGSTDAHTKQILLLLQTKYPSLHIHQKKNGGPSSARNFGIARASGAYILPLDADDTFAPGYITACIHALQHTPGVSPVYCWLSFFGDSDYREVVKEWNYKDILSSNFIVSCSMFSKAAWQKCNGYDENLFGLEDYELWLHMAMLGYRGYCVPGYYVNIRHHKNETSVTSSSRRQDPGDYKTTYIRMKHSIGFWPMMLKRLGLRKIALKMLIKMMKVD